MSKPIMFNNITTRNVVLHITVPKRTGRRRRKGCDGPYLDPAEIKAKLSTEAGNLVERERSRSRLEHGTKHLVRSLQDNEGSYVAKPVGVIEHTHRFRSKSLVNIHIEIPQRRFEPGADDSRHPGFCVLDHKQPVHDQDEGEHITVSMYTPSDRLLGMKRNLTRCR